MFAWVEVAEQRFRRIFKSKWFHGSLQAIAITLCAWWWFHVPVPGKAVLALTIVAVVMTIEALTGWQRALWLVIVFAMAFVENRAINQDRATFVHEQEQSRERESEARQREAEAFQGISDGIKTAISNGQAQFSASMEKANRDFGATMGGLRETVSASTGGDSIPYIILRAEAQPPILTAIDSGRYALMNITANIIDVDKSSKWLKQMLTDPQRLGLMDRMVADTMEWVYIGDLNPQSSRSFTNRAAYVEGDERNLLIGFNARNGSWTEHYGLRKVNGHWLQSVRVFSSHGNKKLLDLTDPGYPEEAKP